MLLYIVRHGDPIYVTDTLTDRGRLQAEAVGERLCAAGINRIFSSPMGRARETAEPACRMLGLEMEIEEWSHEIIRDHWTPYPDGNMKSITSLQSRCFRENGGVDLPYERALECEVLRETQISRALSYIGENGRDFLERLGYREENGLYRILRPSEDRVALFCHGAFTRAWLSILLHIPVHMMWANFGYTHTGVTILNFENTESGFTAPRCLCFSDVSHLWKSGLDLTYDNKIRI